MGSQRSIISTVGITTAIDGLDDNVRASVYREFSNAYTPRLPAADRDDLDRFAESGAGQILVKEWGEAAGRNLAIALYRWDRMTEGLSDTEFAEIDDFYLRRLGANEKASVLRRLAA